MMGEDSRGGAENAEGRESGCAGRYYEREKLPKGYEDAT
jgi:hypothetical protein